MRKQQTAAWLVALAACVGCSDSSERPVEPRPSQDANLAKAGPAEYAPIPCASGASVADEAAEIKRRGERLRLRRPVDFLSVRLSYSGNQQTLAERGAPCAGTVTAAECERALRAVEEKVVTERSTPMQVFALTGSGGQFQSTTTPAAWKELLAPVDTPEAAWFMAMAGAAAPPYVCSNLTESAFRPLADGFELRARKYTNQCKPLELSEFTYRVTVGGEVSQLSRRVVSSDPERCVTD